MCIRGNRQKIWCADHGSEKCKCPKVLYPGCLKILRQAFTDNLDAMKTASPVVSCGIVNVSPQTLNLTLIIRSQYLEDFIYRVDQSYPNIFVGVSLRESNGTNFCLPGH